MATINELNAAEVALLRVKEQLEREPKFVNQQVVLLRIKQARTALDRLTASVENLEYFSTEPEAVIMPDDVQHEVDQALREIRVEKHVEKTFAVPAFNLSGALQ